MAAKNQESVHVLMVTLALQGHMNPLLKLAKRLVSKGIHVTFATNDVARHRMLKSNKSPTTQTTTTTTTTTNPGINLEFFSDGLSHEFDRDRNVASFIESMEKIGSKNFSNLISELTTEDKKFSCIISSPFMPWVPDVAAQYGIPCALLWIQPCAIYSIYYHFFKNPNLFPSLENREALVEIPGMPVLQVRDLPSFISPSGPPVFYTLISHFVENLEKVQWVLCNSFNELEEDMVKSMDSIQPIRPVGPLVSPFLLGKEDNIGSIIDPSMWNAEDSCIEWLDKQEQSSVIYISFGSITILSQEQMDNIAMGLKNSKKPFLWVIKPPEKGSEQKGGVLPFWFQEETKDRGLVVMWCPQEKVLMHQALACFLTHCGWNSTLETVVAGVPVIAHPGWTDQPTNAKLLVDVFKIGVRMKVDENEIASVEEVERCIMEMTDGPRAGEMKKRALEFKEAARKAVGDGGSSDRIIDQFISEIIGK